MSGAYLLDLNNRGSLEIHACGVLSKKILCCFILFKAFKVKYSVVQQFFSEIADECESGNVL